ncbi:MAG: hypothetical protein PVJ76_07770 [Gemmatimonadota bacterium]|jgi:hypothetical protein
MPEENAEGRSSKRWPVYLGALAACLLFLLVVPSLCVFTDAGTGVIGVVLTAGGQPIQGAKAELWAPLSPRSDSLSLADYNVTDSAGCFRLFSFHHPGTVEISVMAGGFEQFTTTTPHGQHAVEVVLVSIGDVESSRGRIAPLSSEDRVRSRCGIDDKRTEGFVSQKPHRPKLEDP